MSLDDLGYSSCQKVPDDDAAIKVSKMPSNLIEVPKVHEKYEINSFCRTNPQYKANLKTLEIISNNRSG